VADGINVDFEVSLTIGGGIHLTLSRAEDLLAAVRPPAASRRRLVPYRKPIDAAKT
jgi:hypothetical protein